MTVGPKRTSGTHTYVKPLSQWDGMARWERQLSAVIHAGSPEERLWAMVLTQAYRDVRGEWGADHVTSARRWISDPSDAASRELTSFEGVCTTLGLDATFVRRDMLRNVA